MVTGLTRQDREALVVELDRQGKTYREIAKEARMSPRDIRQILKKGNLEQTSSVPSQAYKLFSEDKTPLQVAIALNLRESEVRLYYTEYLRLAKLSNLHLVYSQIKDNIGYFVNLCNSALVAGFNVPQVIRLLSITNNDLPSVQYRYQKLLAEESTLRRDHENLVKTHEKLCDDIHQNRLIYAQEKQQLDRISLQKTRLYDYVKHFQNTDDSYLLIKETIKREISFILKDPKQLLKKALLSLIESSRKDPRSFYALCYNKNNVTTTSAGHSQTIGYDDHFYSATSSEEQFLHPDFCYRTESYENMLLSESEKLFNKIIDDIMLRTLS